MQNSMTRRIAIVVNKRWLKRTLLGIGIFLVLFGLFAYFALPGIIKSQAEKLVSEKLHRQLSIERIDVNPYALALDIHGVKLLEPDGKTTFVAFDQLYVNVSLKSLFRFAPVVEEVWLKKPYVHLVRSESNHYNIDDILAMRSNQPTPKNEAPVRFAVYNIQIDGGRVDFEDQPMHEKHVVSDLKLGVPFLSSLSSQIDVFVEPLFSAKINNALLQLKGKARPFESDKDATVDLNLDNVDLTRYVEYLPFQPQFKLPSAKLDVHLTAAFLQPKDKAPQLALKGTAALKALQVTEMNGKPLIKLPQLTVTLDGLNPLSSRLAITRIELDHPEIDIAKNADGTLNLAHLSPPAKRTEPEEKAEQKNPDNAEGLQLALGELSILGAQLNYSDEQGAHPLHAGIDNLDLKVSKTDVDLQKQTVSISTVASSSADFSLVNNKAAKGVAVAAKSSKASTEKAEPGYSVSVGNIAIDNWSAQLEDRTLAKPAVTKVSALTFGMQGLSTLQGKSGKLDLKAQVNQKGQFAITGDVGLMPLHTDLALDLKAVDLMPLQPWFTDQVNLLVTSAALSSKATLKLDQAGDGVLKGNFTGDASIVDLATVDKLSSSDFLRWKALSLSGVNVQLMPLAVEVKQIALEDFFARVIIDPNGHINLQDIALKPGDEQKSLTGVTPQSPAASTTSETNLAPTAPVKAAPRPPIKIRKVVLKHGSVRFSDNFIKPNYTANLKDMSGTVSNLSSDTTTNADVDLHGNVNSAPLNIVGRVNPLSGNLFLDLKADVKGMELAPFTPYSGKYVGYGIEKGKLSFDLAYHLENRKLEAQNRLVLDQLTFGDKIESPTATTLPVGLAVALLRDRNGVIDINLPIGGSLDDPQFSVGGIIIRVIANLITKAVTAPFALLGSLFGDGEELSWLEFDPGRTVVPATGETRLNALAKALVDRPALKLEITGRFDPVTDRDGLRRASMERKVRALKLKQLVSKGNSVDINTVTVTAEEYPVLLDKVYKDANFSKPRNLVGMQKDQPVAEMEKLLMANAKASDDDLVTLSNQRAQVVKDWLVKNGQVPAERIFVIAGKSGDSGDKSKANRVDFSLH